jgi:hypothetical protein
MISVAAAEDTNTLSLKTWPLIRVHTEPFESVKLEAAGMLAPLVEGLTDAPLELDELEELPPEDDAAPEVEPPPELDELDELVGVPELLLEELPATPDELDDEEGDAPLDEVEEEEFGAPLEELDDPDDKVVGGAADPACDDTADPPPPPQLAMRRVRHIVARKAAKAPLRAPIFEPLSVQMHLL